MNKKEYLEGLFCEMAEQRRGGGPPSKLGAIAASHGRPLHPSWVPDGVTPDSPIWRLSGGQNGKRPYYAVLGTNGGWHPARGYFFGRSSYFEFIPIEEIVMSTDLLSAEEISKFNFLG